MAASLSLAAASCVFGIDGRPPVANQFYFPTGLALSAGRSTLYVANSDFDLKYAGGTLQAFDAQALRKAVGPLALALGSGAGAAVACASAGLAVNSDPYLSPGPCASLPIDSFLRNTVFIGAFASSLVLVHSPVERGARLFSPVRGDPSLTYFDVEDDRIPVTSPTFALECSVGPDGFCGDTHRIGRSSAGSLRGLQLPADPIGTAASSDGGALVSAHQTQATTSLIVNPWGATPYISYFTGQLANGPTELAAIPRPAVVAEAAAAASAGNYAVNYRDAFVVTYRGAAQLDLVEYHPDSGSIPARPFLVVAQTFPLTISASNIDSRGVAIVASERNVCEARCAVDGTQLECLAACAESIPLRIYVANRTPASLLVGRVHTSLVREATSEAGASRITAVFHTVEMHGSLALDFGPGHVRVGQVVAADGKLADRVFALSFDARAITIVDPSSDSVEAIVRTGRGPQEFAIDSGLENGTAYSLAYVAHFTDSYLGIVDLDQRHPVTYGQIVASLGEPVPPVGSR